jgi:uncharacterized membrane protein
MPQQHDKYVRLFLGIFISFVAFFALLFGLMYGLKYTFKALDSVSWFRYLFTFFILVVPACIFLTAFAIYAKRTKQHPKKLIRGISYTLFAAITLAWGYCLFNDISTFFVKYTPEIKKYYCYNLGFLFANVVLIFFVGIIQALSAKEEESWLEKQTRLNAMEDDL